MTPRGVGSFIVGSFVDDPTKVKVGFAFCSKQDHFNKKIGRKMAKREETSEVVEVTKLPLILARAREMARGMIIAKATERYFANQFAWIWKYFL